MFHCETGMGSATSLGNQTEFLFKAQERGPPDGLDIPRLGGTATECGPSSKEVQCRLGVEGGHPSATNRVPGLSQPTSIDEVNDLAGCSAPEFGRNPAGLFVSPSTNLPRTRNGTKIRQYATQDVSDPPGFAAGSHNTFASVYDLASTNGLIADPRSGIHRQHDVQSLNRPSVQPSVPGCQRFKGGSWAGTTCEASAGTVGGTEYLLLPGGPQRSHVPAAIPHAPDTSRQPYEYERPWLRAPPSDSVGSTESSLEGPHPLHPQQVGCLQGQIPTAWTGRDAPGGNGILEGASTKTERTGSTHTRLEKPKLPYLPAPTLPSDATPFPAHTHATKAGTAGVVGKNDVHPSSSKSKQSTSCVQRTERSRHGKLAEKPLYLQRKKHVSREGNVVAIQERCRGQGGDSKAIGYLSRIFEEGMNPKALSRKITKEEIANQVFDPSTEPRQVYWALLAQQVKDGFPRYVCRLCPEETRYPYKNGKDVLPHILKYHIGTEGKTGKFGGVSFTIRDPNLPSLVPG